MNLFKNELDIENKVMVTKQKGENFKVSVKTQVCLNVSPSCFSNPRNS